MSKERYVEIANKNRGNKRTQEFRELMRQNALKQPPKSAETIEKQRIASKEYHKTHPNSFKGKTHTEESKRKMRETLSHRITIHKDNKTVRVMDYNLSKYIEQGWQIGKQK